MPLWLSLIHIYVLPKGFKVSTEEPTPDNLKLKGIDYYHRYKEDIKLFAGMGFKVYRLSLIHILPEAMSGAMGNQMYVATFSTREEMEQFYSDVLAVNDPVNAKVQKLSLIHICLRHWYRRSRLPCQGAGLEG